MAILDTLELQKTIYKSVKDRGYVDSWPKNEFIARQVAKLQEEVSEFADFCKLPAPLRTKITAAGECARINFDMSQIWAYTNCSDWEAASKELADIVVVALCTAQAMGYDVLEGAMLKAGADIARGVRNGDNHDTA